MRKFPQKKMIDASMDNVWIADIACTQFKIR